MLASTLVKSIDNGIILNPFTDLSYYSLNIYVDLNNAGKNFKIKKINSKS